MHRHQNLNVLRQSTHWQLCHFWCRYLVTWHLRWKKSGMSLLTTGRPKGSTLWLWLPKVDDYEYCSKRESTKLILPPEALTVKHSTRSWQIPLKKYLYMHTAPSNQSQPSHMCIQPGTSVFRQAWLAWGFLFQSPVPREWSPLFTSQQRSLMAFPCWLRLWTFLTANVNIRIIVEWEVPRTRNSLAPT